MIASEGARIMILASAYGESCRRRASLAPPLTTQGKILSPLLRLARPRDGSQRINSINQGEPLRMKAGRTTLPGEGDLLCRLDIPNENGWTHRGSIAIRHDRALCMHEEAQVHAGCRTWLTSVSWREGIARAVPSGHRLSTRNARCLSQDGYSLQGRVSSGVGETERHRKTG